jgi:TPR repeat protein
MNTEETKKRAYLLWSSASEDEQELAMDMMTRIAREGDLQAMKLVAQWHYTLGDPDSALHFWKEAAELHDLSSIMMVAQVYSEMDEMTHACEYWTKAAQQGDPTAISQLSKYHQSIQDGIPDSESLCYEYTKKCADLGDTHSMKLLAEWRKPTMDQKSYDLYYKAACHGDSEGYIQCGRMKYQGIGVE